MTAAKQLFWQRVQRRSADLQGPVRNAVLKVFAHIRDNVDDATVRTLIKEGAIEEIIGTALSDEFLDRATLPLSMRIRKTIERGFDQTIDDIPKAGKIDGVRAVAFDVLSPNVSRAIETVESPVLLNIKKGQRALVRAIIQAGLEDGQSVNSIAIDLRTMIGLGPDQLKQVQNFRRALRGERNIEGYTLRDKRIDALLKKGPLTSAQVDRYTKSYLNKRIASNTATVTRSITFDAYKQGQRLTWEEAKDMGVVPDGYSLWKTWVQIPRPTAREDHTEMNGEKVPFDEPYSNGSMVPGDQGEYNCGCVSLVTVERD